MALSANNNVRCSPPAMPRNGHGGRSFYPSRLHRGAQTPAHPPLPGTRGRYCLCFLFSCLHQKNLNHQHLIRLPDLSGSNLVHQKSQATPTAVIVHQFGTKTIFRVQIFQESYNKPRVFYLVKKAAWLRHLFAGLICIRVQFQSIAARPPEFSTLADCKKHSPSEDCSND